MSACDKCFHAWDCLICGEDFEDCSMIQEKHMRLESDIYTEVYLDVDGSWKFKINNVTHKEVTRPKEVDIPVVYTKRNINLRRD